MYLSGSFVLIMRKIPIELIRTIFFCLALKNSHFFFLPHTTELKLHPGVGSVADPGGGRGGHGPPPGPVKIGHKKYGCRRRPHRFHVSRPPRLTQPLDPLLWGVSSHLVIF